MTIGKRLLEIRKETKLSQADFGKLFNLSDRAYKNYELEIRDLPIQIAIGICEKFNVSANWLLLGRGDRTAEMLALALLKAKQAAQKYMERNRREYSETEIAEIEAVFLTYIQEEGRPREDALDKLMEGLPNATI